MGRDSLVLSILNAGPVAGRVACRDRIVVSTLHCGCSNLGSNPSLGTIVLLPSDLLFLPSRRNTNAHLSSNVSLLVTSQMLWDMWCRDDSSNNFTLTYNYYTLSHLK